MHTKNLDIKNKTIGVFAHVDAGKTTFSEAILYNAKRIKNLGRVDNKNSFLDSHSIEKERGITIFSGQACFPYNNSKYFLIDTPGHVDFSPEMERAIKILDYAIILVSATRKVQAHTETIFNLLKKNKVPTVFFVNKVDREEINFEEVLNDIKFNLTEDIFDMTDENIDKELSNNMYEFIAQRDENLFDLYLNDELDYMKFKDEFVNMIKENKVYPLFKGAALLNKGIVEFLDTFDLITTTNYDSKKEEFKGKVYKISYDKDGVRTTHIKALEGTLKTRDEITYKLNEDLISEKVTEIRIFNGDKYKSVNSCEAGEVFGILGISKLKVGSKIGDLDKADKYEFEPILKSKVNFDKSISKDVVLKNFKILEQEEPSLNVIWDEELNELSVHVMGVIELEVLQEIVKERFNLDVSFGECGIMYKETIENKSFGGGHFEPLKHYAEVHLKIEPLDRNSGIVFETNCHTDDLGVNYQNLVKTHIFERDHRGLITGSPLTDIKITLIGGASHNKHTSGGDFREATFRALRAALSENKSVVLEPFYKFKISFGLDYLGRILSDIQKLNGTFEPAIINGDRVVIIGRGPVKTFMNYPLQIMSITKGRGFYSFKFDGYDYCHNEEEVIKNIAYNKNEDKIYSSSSIFCSKGKAYYVHYSEAKKFFHWTSEIIK